ncbi:hypothetical protein [Nitrosomonas communis]|uniref:DUF3987 domain-containing protein n=1 Tax=Nitrosomonas communis TaxID=44574 RepID=A0A1H2Y2T8_9PROT|nr:hypothetical protein [Nitrosomonas communis]SDW99533.1 hypothetical protein SAMN05421882_104611 [Nitrosomonas communis]
MEISHDNGMDGSPETGKILDTQTHHKINKVAFLPVIFSHPINSVDQSDIHSQYFCSGISQYHSNEKGVATRKPYSTININEIYELVDNPHKVDKTQAQWIIVSTLLSRSFKKQEDEGEYWFLWLDLDKNPKPIDQLAPIIKLLGCDYEIYTSRSATIDCQKARILIPLEKPLCFADWVVCQQILNDLLESNGVTPDRANERAAQLCYLPNRGDFYQSLSQRNNTFFNPLKFWPEEIQNRQAEIARQAAVIAKDAEAAIKRRNELKSSAYPNNELSDLIGAFNEAYSVQEILLKAGYQQRGHTFRHPNSQSGSYSASLMNRRIHSLSTSDSLYTAGQGAHDAFSAFTVLFYNGDRNSALKDAGDHWVIIGGNSWNSAKQREYANNISHFVDHSNVEDEQSAKTKREKINHGIDYPPGLVGEIAEYIFTSSRMQINSFAIAGALTAMSHLNKNHAYVRKSMTALNLYQCITGDTGKGKEEPRKAIKRLLDAANYTQSIHEGIASGAAFLRSLEKNPNSLLLSDEFGIYLQSALSDRGSIHDKAFIKELMIFYGLGRSYFAGKTYADERNNIGRIDKPYINVLGTTTGLELIEGITPKTIDNGFLNRILIISANEENPVNRAPDTKISENLKSAMRKIVSSVVKDIPLEYEAGAHDLLIKLVEAVNEKGQFANLWVRAEEQTIRVAGLLARGDGNIIKQAHVKWAWHYVSGSIKAFSKLLDRDLAENNFQKLIAKALKYIENARDYSSDRQFDEFCKRGMMPRGKLTKLLKLKPKETEDVITYLLESRLVTRCEFDGTIVFTIL